MTAQELRQQAKRRLENLSVDRLRVADDFLAYLENREDSAATRDLVKIPGAVAEFEKAKKDIRAGRSKDWRKARRDV